MSSRHTRQSSRIPQLVRFGAGPSLAFLEGPKLLLATDAILAALIVIFPFIMGGREAWGHRILITLALALGCVWSLHKIRTGGRLRAAGARTADRRRPAAGLVSDGSTGSSCAGEDFAGIRTIASRMDGDSAAVRGTRGTGCMENGQPAARQRLSMRF